MTTWQVVSCSEEQNFTCFSPVTSHYHSLPILHYRTITPSTVIIPYLYCTVQSCTRQNMWITKGIHYKAESNFTQHSRTMQSLSITQLYTTKHSYNFQHNYVLYSLQQQQTLTYLSTIVTTILHHTISYCQTVEQFVYNKYEIHIIRTHITAQSCNMQHSSIKSKHTM